MYTQKNPVDLLHEITEFQQQKKALQSRINALNKLMSDLNYENTKISNVLNDLENASGRKIQICTAKGEISGRNELLKRSNEIDDEVKKINIDLVKLEKEKNNLEKNIIEKTKQYKEYYYNPRIPRLDFQKLDKIYQLASSRPNVYKELNEELIQYFIRMDGNELKRYLLNVTPYPVLTLVIFYQNELTIKEIFKLLSIHKGYSPDDIIKMLLICSDEESWNCMHMIARFHTRSLMEECLNLLGEEGIASLFLFTKNNINLIELTEAQESFNGTSLKNYLEEKIRKHFSSLTQYLTNKAELNFKIDKIGIYWALLYCCQNNLKALDYLNSNKVQLENLNLQNLEEMMFNRMKNLLNLPAIKIHLKTLSLIGCNLTDGNLENLVPYLNNLKSLQCLNLNSNYISIIGFFYLLQNLKNHPTLEELAIQNNRIEVVDNNKFNKDLENCNIKIKKIDIKGNYIQSMKDKKNTVMKNLLKALLLNSNLTLYEFHKIKFLDIFKNVPFDNYKLFYLHKNEEFDMQLTEKEINLFDEYGKLASFRYEELVFDDIRRGFQQIMRQQSLRTIKFNELDEIEKKQCLKQLLSHHPEAPVKYILHKQAFGFFNAPCLTEKFISLLDETIEISVQNWCVHLLAKRTMNPFGEHAMLAMEGIHKNGQRFFKIVHLTAEKDTQTKEYSIKIGYYDYDKNLAIAIVEVEKDYFSEKFHCASFPCSVGNTKVLFREVQEEMFKGLPRKYSKLTSLQCCQNDDEVQNKNTINCLTWAVDKINKHLKENIEIVDGGIPSANVQNILHKRNSNYKENHSIQNFEIETNDETDTPPCRLF